MKKTGQLLKAAREEKGLSLHEIALSLKLSTKVLRAIEENDSQNLPAKTFLRGFVQSYAQYLKLDVEKIMVSFSEEMGSTRPTPTIKVEGSDEPAQNETPVGYTERPTPNPEVNQLENAPSVQIKPIIYGVVFVILLVLIGFVKKVVDRYQKEAKVNPTSVTGSALSTGSGANTGATNPSPSPTPEQQSDLSPSASATATPGTSASNNSNASAASTSAANPTLGVGATTTASSTPTNSSASTGQTTSTTDTKNPAIKKDLALPLTHQNSATASIADNKKSPEKTKTEAKIDVKTESKSPAKGEVKSDAKTESKADVKAESKVENKPDNKADNKADSKTEDANKPIELIVESMDSVEIEYSASNGKSGKIKLNADQVHTFRSSHGLKLKISNGGAVNLVLNGKDIGVPGELGKSISLSY